MSLSVKSNGTDKKIDDLQIEQHDVVFTQLNNPVSFVKNGKYGLIRCRALIEQDIPKGQALSTTVPTKFRPSTEGLLQEVSNASLVRFNSDGSFSISHALQNMTTGTYLYFNIPYITKE